MYSILIGQSAKALTPLALAVHFFNYMDYGHLHVFETQTRKVALKNSKMSLKNQLLQKTRKIHFLKGTRITRP